MNEKQSPLHSQYIIDGIRYDATPAELLDECLKDTEVAHPDAYGCTDIIDESIDPPVSTFTYDSSRNKEYLGMCLQASDRERTFRMLYPETFTRQRIAKALIDRLWNEGHFRLGDLDLWARWTWNTRPLGNMAAFYRSAEAAGTYIFDLDVRLGDYLFEETDEESNAGFYAWLPEKDADYDEERHTWISEDRKCPDKLLPDPSSWLIYIPFDTCAYKIGGSLLAQVQGRNGGTGPHICDPDYFIDCYEVVRELAEDGIIMSGATVMDGGLATAAALMCGDCGIDIDLEGILSSYQENDTTKIMFSETPGVLLQISDNDYDYIDSQLLLQDVAYYPLGHPVMGHNEARFLTSGRTSVADILATLMEQASEGED